jgi:hypothetical protein
MKKTILFCTLGALILGFSYYISFGNPFKSSKTTSHSRLVIPDENQAPTVFEEGEVLPENSMNAFKAASNTARRSNITAILNALLQYRADHGSYPSAITDGTRTISKKEADICSDLVPKYIPALPRDERIKASPDQTQPLSSSVSDCAINYVTGFTIQKAGNTLTISAPLAEDNQTISISR